MLQIKETEDDDGTGATELVQRPFKVTRKVLMIQYVSEEDEVKKLYLPLTTEGTLNHSHFSPA